MYPTCAHVMAVMEATETIPMCSPGEGEELPEHS